MKYLKKVLDWFRSLFINEEKIEEDIKNIVETAFEEHSKESEMSMKIHQKVEEFKQSVNSTLETFNTNFIKSNKNKEECSLKQYGNELSLNIALQPTVKSVRASTKISEEDPKDIIVNIIAVSDSIHNAKMEMKVTMKECAEFFIESES